MNFELRHRKGISPKLVSVRALTHADLSELHRPPARTRIQKLRDTHHMIARLLAMGKTATEVARIVGMSRERVGALRQDPTVAELISKYRAEVHEIWREHVDAFAEEATLNMKKAERQIGEQLDDADETGDVIPLRELARITADRMDRFGYGKHTTSTNINVGFAAKLEACISRSRKVAAE